MFTTTATNLPRLMRCNGSRLMAGSIPASAIDPTDRDEGNAAHWMAQAVFDGRHTLEELIDRKAPNGFYMTAEMAEHVGSYLSALECGRMEVETSFGTDQWRVNARADHIACLCAPNDQYETPNHVIVDDFKYGWGIVDPEENWTLIAHAVGYCLINQISPQMITLRIHQPRPYHLDGKLRAWTITYDELIRYYWRIVETMSAPSDMLQTGPQCTRCRALATCPAARKAGYNAIDAADIAFDDTVDNTLLAFELDTLRTAQSTLDRRVQALEELAKYRLTGGAVIENYALEHQYGHRRFKKEFDASMIKAFTGIDAAKSATVTPAELERRGASPALVAMISDKPMVGVKLVRVSANKRAEKLLGKKEAR